MKQSMKTFLAAVALVVSAAFPCHAYDGGTDYNLVVYTADGTRTAYAFGDHPRLTISGSTFTITTGDTKADYAATDIARFTLEEQSGEPVTKAWWLIVSLRDGTIEGYPFADRPKLTIAGDVFTVASAARAVDYAATAIDRFTLADHHDGDVHTKPTPPEADVNGDGVTDVADISAIINVMAEGDMVVELVKAADVNHDGVVDVADISAVISAMAAHARMTTPTP